MPGQASIGGDRRHRRPHGALETRDISRLSLLKADGFRDSEVYSGCDKEREKSAVRIDGVPRPLQCFRSDNVGLRRLQDGQPGRMSLSESFNNSMRLQHL